MTPDSDQRMYSLTSIQIRKVTAIAGAVRGEAQHGSVDVKYTGSHWNKEVRSQNWAM
jgi:hypothetical protein